jgi:hypothetical protein
MAESIPQICSHGQISITACQCNGWAVPLNTVSNMN